MNLKPIKKGSTYSFTLKLWNDAAKTDAVDISGYEFTLVAKDAAGTTVINLSDTAFIETSATVRTVTLSDTVTAAYPAGELYYQVDATLPDTTKAELFDGYIQVLA